jgi:hypothetical protein
MATISMESGVSLSIDASDNNQRLQGELMIYDGSVYNGFFKSK